MNKVVSFEQGNEYLRKRADVNRRAGRLLEALSLERRAAEQEPDSLVCRMEIARTLTEMKCYVASNKIIYGVLADKRAPAECYFGLCSNYTAMNQKRAAKRALAQFLARDEAGTEREEVRRMAENMDSLGILMDLQARRVARYSRLIERADEKKVAGDLRGAELLIHWAISENPRLSVGWMDLAEISCAQGKWMEAMRAVERAARAGADGLELLMAALRVYHGEGRTARARAMLARLEKKRADSAMAAGILLDAYCLLKDDEQVRLLAPRVLSGAPYDGRLLHICAVNRVREGRSTEQAVSFWMRAVRIDPNDAVARYNLWLIAAERLDKDMSYEYAIPEKERQRWRQALAEAQWLTEAQLKESYHKSRKLEDKCRWALSSGERQPMLLARALLRRLDEPETQRLLREGIGERVTPAEEPGAVVSLTGESDDVRAPRTLRRAIKVAQRAAEEEHGQLHELLEQLALEVMRHKLWVAVRDERAWAAVLLYTSTKLNGGEMTMARAAKRVNAPARRARRCFTLVGITPDQL